MLKTDYLMSLKLACVCGPNGLLLIVIKGDPQQLNHHKQHNQYAATAGRDQVKGFNGS